MTFGLNVPWRGRERPAAGGSHLLVVTCLRPARWIDVPTFLRLSGAAIDDMREHPGFIGHALRLHPFERAFLTLSAWQDIASMTAFVRGDAHRAAMRWMAGGDHRFRSVRMPGSAVDWPEAVAALELAK